MQRAGRAGPWNGPQLGKDQGQKQPAEGASEAKVMDEGGGVRERARVRPHLFVYVCDLVCMSLCRADSCASRH